VPIPEKAMLLSAERFQPVVLVAAYAAAIPAASRAQRSTVPTLWVI
jgi:hypothetical protein